MSEAKQMAAARLSAAWREDVANCEACLAVEQARADNYREALIAVFNEAAGNINESTFRLNHRLRNVLVIANVALSPNPPEGERS